MSDSTSPLATFQIQLLTKIIDMEKFPFTKMIIEHELSKDEYNELLHLLEILNRDYLEQKEEGLLDYSSLLIHFVGMLNEKLEPKETIYSLKQEGYYPQLMTEFLDLIKKDGL